MVVFGLLLTLYFHKLVTTLLRKLVFRLRAE